MSPPLIIASTKASMSSLEVYRYIDILQVAGVFKNSFKSFAQCCPLLIAIPCEFNKVASSCAKTSLILNVIIPLSAVLL